MSYRAESESRKKAEADLKKEKERLDARLRDLHLCINMTDMQLSK